MQDHKRNKFVPLTVEAEDNHTVYALAKIKAIENKLDAVAAHVERLRAALDRAYEGAARQLAEPRHHGNDQYALTDIATTCELALAATPKQSLSAIKVKTLREVAGKQVYAEPHPVNDYVSRWLLTEADRIEREEV